jgi:hypothetical protein
MSDQLAAGRGVTWMPRINRSPFAVTLALLAVLIGASVAEAQSGSDDIPTFVSPPKQPTEVAIGAYLIGLSRVSEPSEPFPTYEVEIFVNVTWHDPRLAFGDGDTPPHVFLEEEAEEKLSEIWAPDLEIQNEIEQRSTESVELTIRPDGSVDYEERFGAMLNAEFDLRKFPFDRQTLDIELQSFVWDRGEVLLLPNEAQTGFDPDFQTPEWTVTAVETLIDTRSEVRDDREFSSFTLRIHARRHTGHYLLRLLLPLFFVMALTWFAFWEPLEDRYRVGFIALLTVVATHTVVSRSLPRLAYPTLVDAVLITCYLVATALIVVSIVVRRIDEGGHTERAQRIDRWARWLLPLGAAVFLASSALILWS